MFLSVSAVALSSSADTLDRLVVTQISNDSFITVLSKKTAAEISGTQTVGRGAAFSGDRRFIAFKWVGDIGGDRWQAPVILDLQTLAVRWLHAPVPLAGNPRFDAGGRVYFSIGQSLYIMTIDDAGTPGPATVFPIPSYCNTIAVRPDGRRVALTDALDRLYLLDTGSGSIETIDGAANACYPEWSPDGSRLAYRTIDGKLFYLENDVNEPVPAGNASTYAWLPDSSGFIVSIPRFQGDRISHQAVIEMDLHGSETVLCEFPGFYPQSPELLPDGHTIRIREQETGTIYALERDFPIRQREDPRPVDVPEPDFHVHLNPPLPEVERTDNRSIMTIRGVPFQHQVYCTPAAFNGHWACNGTAAVMAVAYYNLLGDWDFVASTPFAHTSHWGRYVSQIYTYGGYTFNTGSPDASGNMAYGAYGYIVKNDWADTKTYMKEYIQYHGLGSAVDWSPTWSELQAKTASRQPFVLLSSITSSGHYKTVVGYISGQHTVYFNDPYGNKNQGYMNFNGAGVAYDWPGYNNGYENLNTVWCYIYADGTPPVDPHGTEDNPVVIASFPFTDVNSTRSSSGQDLYNYYNCAPTVNESGREIVYMLPLTQSGTLNASVSCDQDVDIDIHLLSDLNPSTCLTRAHISFTYHIGTPGNYYLTCDTFVESDNLELMGDYTLNVTFDPDSTPTPVPTTPTPAPVPLDHVGSTAVLLILVSLGLLLSRVSRR